MKGGNNQMIKISFWKDEVATEELHGGLNNCALNFLQAKVFQTYVSYIWYLLENRYIDVM